MSSSLYLSPAEAVEALRTLTSLCPEFLKSVVIDRGEWLQMTAAQLTLQNVLLVERLLT